MWSVSVLVMAIGKVFWFIGKDAEFVRIQEFKEREPRR